MGKPPSIVSPHPGDGSFRVEDPSQAGPVYFPLVNEAGLMSAITPDLAGDIKIDQHAFITPPAAYEDLRQSRLTRNFWLSFNGRQNATVVGERPFGLAARGCSRNRFLRSRLFMAARHAAQPSARRRGIRAEFCAGRRRRV